MGGMTLCFCKGGFSSSRGSNKVENGFRTTYREYPLSGCCQWKMKLTFLTGPKGKGNCSILFYVFVFNFFWIFASLHKDDKTQKLRAEIQI